jgi:hypothetical protein
MKNHIIVSISTIFLLLNIVLMTSCTAQSGNEEDKAVKTEIKTENENILATQKPKISSKETQAIDQNLQKIEHALSSGVYDNNPEMKKKLQEMADRLEADRKKIPVREKTAAAKKAKKGETIYYTAQDEKTGETIMLEMTKEEYKVFSEHTGEDVPFEDKKNAINKLKK